MSALPLLTALALARACAPDVAPQTLLSVAQIESGLDPLSIGVNGRPRTSLHPVSRADAVQRARALLADGHDLDLGLAQINVRNLDGLRLSLDQAFNPCLNLQGAAAVLTRAFLRERDRRGDPQAALVAALSAYNTGDAERGVRNGYVAKVYQAAAHVVPALQVAGVSEPPAGAGAGAEAVLLQAAPAPDAAPPSAALDVFAREPASTLVWSSRSAPRTDRPRPQPKNRTQGEPS